MYGTVEVIPLEKIISYDELYGEQCEASSLKTGMIKRICFRLYDYSSFITYDIDGGFKKYVNVEDGLSSPSIKRDVLSFQTAYELKDSVMIEIAGLKRCAVVDSIEVNWVTDSCIVLYGVRDKTDTVYYGISEKLLVEWSEV
jgi:hypothetical protein